MIEMAPFILPVTFTFIALCAIVLLAMTAWVGTQRGVAKALRGDAGDPVLFKRSRIHGNFVENAPIAALTLGAAEMLGMGPLWLWLAFVAFFAGRILHYFMYDMKTRGFPMILTQAPGLVLGVWILWKLWGF